ncbi:hypothetical protein HG535_0A01130 [Zygotorulaspora mrakii]|uniref:Orc1-like AAA ATPase domain-containing protein n=1 Tax=Zygotorulaspora mrakii TaxID=42260 RepID=A0A7H9AVU8_ZYGMR|nr:uncharacterized protein HG535_0A01130 [Zygotorulaspora mrakii]QLG70174.1 hypothetical protein HG535_0A01130 [Zygotorulaspora mrakii]
MISYPEDVLFRDYQLKSVAAFVHGDPTIACPNLIIQGNSSSGKTYVLQKFFEANPSLINAWLEPIELVSWKPLLQAVVRSVQNKLKILFCDLAHKECDPLEVEEPFLLVKALWNIFSQYDSLPTDINFFLVLDGFDRLQDLDAALFNKFIKFHELINTKSKIHLKLIYMIQDIAFVERYSSHCLPMIVFPSYSIEQIIEILIFTRVEQLVMSNTLRERIIKQGVEECTDEQFVSVAANYIKLIVQAFHSYTGNNINALNDFIDFKWHSYVQKITKENIFDPLALYRSSINLFLTTDDSFVEDEDNRDNYNEPSQTYELSAISKYLLIAAYICSYLGPRYDSNVFSRRSYLKSGRSSYGRRKKMETNPRYLQPSLFHLERLFAIFQAIFPVERTTESGSLASLREEALIRANVEVFQNLAELHVLKMVSTTVTKNIDFLSHKTKWKVNVPWEIVLEVAKSVNFDISQYFSGL